LSTDAQLFIITVVLFFTRCFCTILLNITMCIITKAELIYLVYTRA